MLLHKKLKRYPKGFPKERKARRESQPDACWAFFHGHHFTQSILFCPFHLMSFQATFYLKKVVY